VLRPVSAGRFAGLAAEITAGLREGETVIVHPGSAVEEGRRVAPQEGG
jgi:hypothetical protein